MFLGHDSLNYFITFRTYGTWLHGDERGSVDASHNRYGQEYLAPSGRLREHRQGQMTWPPLIFDLTQRQCATETAIEVALHRGWVLHNVETRTNHLHLLISAPDSVSVDKICNDIKARITRVLRERGLVEAKREVWAEGASKKHIFGPVSGERIDQYIKEFQNDPQQPR